LNSELGSYQESSKRRLDQPGSLLCPGRFCGVVTSVAVNVALLGRRKLRFLCHHTGLEALDGYCPFVLRSRVDFLAAEVQTERAPSTSVISGALLLKTTSICSFLVQIQSRGKLHFPDSTCRTQPFPDTTWQVQMQLDYVPVSRVTRTSELLCNKELCEERE
jgi:hypothetical protein